VLVADADPQNTALHWAGMGEGFPAEVEDVSGEEGKLHKALRKRQEDFDYIVIDSPPAAFRAGDRQRPEGRPSRPGAGDPLAP
jgi:cellulose biosynthesis protein BcsQ